MEKITLKVDGMACEHCARTITNALKTLPGIRSVSVDLKIKTVTAEYDPAHASPEKLKREIEDQGYDVIA